MEKTEYFVIRKADGDFMAVDTASGGYECWTDSFLRAELFKPDKRGFFYLNEARRKEPSGVEAVPIILGDPLSADEFLLQHEDFLRKEALSKLSDVEKKILGLL